MLGGCIGPGQKVIGGFDFVGDAYTGEQYLAKVFVIFFHKGLAWVLGGNTPVPDSDPLDQCNGHGTHVAVCDL